MFLYLSFLERGQVIVGLGHFIDRQAGVTWMRIQYFRQRCRSFRKLVGLAYRSPRSVVLVV